MATGSFVGWPHVLREEPQTPLPPFRATTVCATVVAALLAVAGCQAALSSSSTPSLLQSQGQPQEADGDGELPHGVTVFDDQYPAIANLRPALLSALRSAATDAKQRGITVQVNSGWRSTSYQQRLFTDAVARYGSSAEAAKWVAPPASSSHVSGDAVDLGPSSAETWLSAHGAAHGLCQVYANEPWHYELRPYAAADGCPARYADATQDPRLHR